MPNKIDSSGVTSKPNRDGEPANHAGDEREAASNRSLDDSYKQISTKSGRRHSLASGIVGECGMWTTGFRKSSARHLRQSRQVVCHVEPTLWQVHCGTTPCLRDEGVWVIAGQAQERRSEGFEARQQVLV